MADKAISAFTDGAPAQPAADYHPIARAGANYKLTWEEMCNTPGQIGLTTRNAIAASFFAIATATVTTAAASISPANITGITPRGVYVSGAFASTGTSAATAFQADIQTAAAAYTVTDLTGFKAGTFALGAASAATNVKGFWASNSIVLSGPTLQAGFYSDISAATGVWQAYLSGTGNNYLGAGFTGINTTSASASEKLRVNGAIYGDGIITTAGGFVMGTLGYSDTNILLSLQASANSYVQSILRNSNAGAAASADFIVSNDQGTATTHYADFGINSSAFSGAGSFALAGASYLYASDGDLVLGTFTSNVIRFAVNNGATDAATISTAGLLSALNGFTVTGGAVTMSPANFSVTMSPTGTGTVTVNPATAGTLNNLSIGQATALAGTFTTAQAATYNIGASGPTLVQDAAAVSAFKNSTTAQAVRVYGTTTGPKYISVSHDGTNGIIDTAASSGTLNIGTTNAASGITIGHGNTFNTVFPGIINAGGANNVTALVQAGGSATHEYSGTTTIGFAADFTQPTSGTVAAQAFSAILRTVASSFTVTDLVSFDATVNIKGAGSTITNTKGLWVRNALAVGTNNYGVYSDINTATTTWQLYMAGTAACYFAAAIGIGQTSPTALLHIKAGTATASTAPLKFTSGTNLTTAEAGAMEYNGTNLFFTRTGTTREAVLVGITGAAAPATNAIGVILDYFGTSATRVLTTPDAWVAIVLSDGSTKKMPAYA